MDEQVAPGQTQTKIGSLQRMKARTNNQGLQRHWLSRDQVRKAKALIELNLASDVKGKNKGFYKCISDTRKTWKNVSPLQKQMGDLVTLGMEAAYIPSEFFASVFICNCVTHTARVAEGKGRDWEQELPNVGDDQVQDHLRNHIMHKSMGPDEAFRGPEGSGGSSC